MVREIATAGGPNRWSPPTRIEQDDVTRDIWRFLKRYGEAGNKLPPLYVSWGEGDRLAPGARMLAGLLPPDHAISIPGGHDWPTWSRLWKRFLATGALEATCR